VNPFYLGSLFVFLSAAGFGVMSIFAEYAYQAGATVTGILFWRFLLAALLFFAIVKMQRASLRINLRQAAALFLLGGGLYTLQSFSFFSAVQYITPSLAALILYTFPIFVSILAFVVDKEKITRATIGAILLSVAGVALVLGNSFEGIHPVGVGFAFAAALFYSFYIIIGNRVVQNLPPMVTSGYIALFAFLSYLVIALTGEGIPLHYTGQAWLAISGIVLCSTVLAIGTFFVGLRLIGSTKASVLSTIEPVITSVCSVLLLGERLTGWQLLGGLIVLLGAALIVATRGKTGQQQTSASGNSVDIQG